jgi:hypothetical protein
MTDRDETIKAIRTALKQRSGKTWSVTGGRGTAWGWITISAPPARRVNGYMSDQDRAELAWLLGLRFVTPQGEHVPAGGDYYREYIARAAGLTPEVIGRPYWD